MLAALVVSLVVIALLFIWMLSYRSAWKEEKTKRLDVEGCCDNVRESYDRLKELADCQARRLIDIRKLTQT